MSMTKIIAIALGAALLSGCASNAGDTRNTKSESAPIRIQSNGQSPAELTEGRHIVPIKTLHNAPYVSLDDFAQATGYHGAWLRGGGYGVGDNDPAWMFRTGESNVDAGDESVNMSAPAVKEGNALYIPVDGLTPLFGSVTVFTVESGQVAFFPKPTPEETGVSGGGLDFGDANPAAAPTTAKHGASAGTAPQAIPAIADSDRDNMIAFAKKYMGVKYEFGAESYSESKTFDCSTFVRYIYDHFGLDLPRLARQQAKKGKTVDRDKLEPGDLLFFYVPGRFKSNETVGHVGMYYGGGKMIHASPKPEDGVQITDINKDYWKDTFLYAKRLI